MPKSSFLKRYIGDKAFYVGVISLIVPMIVQMGITGFVNLLDNVMVGQLGTEEITSVAIVNQIIFVFNLTIFGGVSGASIFGAQFYGKNDLDGLRDSFRYRLLMAIVVSAAGILLFVFQGEWLVGRFFNEAEGDTGNLALAMDYAKRYMGIMLWGLLPFALTQCFASTLKDTGETLIPMKASLIAIFANLILNYLLIYGKFGLPQLGVAGAAIATMISRYIELGYIVFATVRRRRKFPFMLDALKSPRVPFALVKRITVTGLPLLVNELFWALGTTLIAQAYSVRGMNAMAAVNITNTIWNIFGIIMMAMGSAIGIIIGQMLGANEIQGAKDCVKKLLFFSVGVNVVVGLLVIAAAPLVPQIYNTDDAVKATATRLLMIAGAFLPVDAFVGGTYFTIRSGGKTLITFIFDCFFQMAVAFPLAFVLANYTSLRLEIIYLCVHSVNFIKIIIGALMLKSGVWATNVVDGKKAQA